MIVGTLDLKTVALKHDHLWLKQAKDMTLFQITYKELSYINRTNPEEGLRMLIVLKRKIMTEIMTTFFPSVLLTLITFATTLFKPIYFEASLSVNLTTMLVMTTIFISKMEGLPPTSDIKMIDIWLVLCQMVPFAEVVLLTAMEYNRKDKKKVKRSKKKGKRKSRNIQTTSLAVAPMDENRREDDGQVESVEMHVGVSGEVEPEEKWSQMCWIPHLKTIGT